MPLDRSPIDGAPMQRVRRHGVEIDVCQRTGGVWLARGELEALIERVRKDAQKEIPARQRWREEEDDDDNDHHDAPIRSTGRRSRPFDIFDF